MSRFDPACLSKLCTTSVAIFSRENSNVLLFLLLLEYFFYKVTYTFYSSRFFFFTNNLTFTQVVLRAITFTLVPKKVTHLNIECTIPYYFLSKECTYRKLQLRHYPAIHANYMLHHFALTVCNVLLVECNHITNYTSGRK